MRIQPLDEQDLYHVACRMREWDRKEIFATRWSDSNESLVDDLMRIHNVEPPFAWTFGLDEPIAALGAFPAWPCVWFVWMFATDDFPKIGLSMTKFVKRQVIPILKNHAHRVECRTMEGHVDAQRWLQVLGAKQQATLTNYGKGKENFLVYKWEIDDII